jgi:hypothetical protein
VLRFGACLVKPCGSPSHICRLLVCQHAARRIASLDLLKPNAAEAVPLATEWNGRRLNGPNDMVLNEGGPGDSAKYIYFTDPVYAWLEKTRFEDLPYLDERVKKDGPGHSGVYRTKLGTGKVELLATMDRPNGIGFTYARDLIVSECCQGTHNPRCPQGTSRWVAFKQSPSNGSDWRRHAVVDDVLDTATAGCADGFAVVDRPYPLLLATCAGGLCIVCHPNPNPPRVYASMCTPQRMSPPAPSLMTVRVAGTG